MAPKANEVQVVPDGYVLIWDYFGAEPVPWVAIASRYVCLHAIHVLTYSCVTYICIHIYIYIYIYICIYFGLRDLAIASVR